MKWFALAMFVLIGRYDIAVLYVVVGAFWELAGWIAQGVRQRLAGPDQESMYAAGRAAGRAAKDGD